MPVKIADKIYAIDKPNKVKEGFEITYLIGCSSVEVTMA
jgi:hypothetical protein